MRALFKGLLTDGVSTDASGIDADITSNSFQVSAGEGMTVIVNKGFAICGGCLKYQEGNITLPISEAGTQNRIDAVVLRLNDNDAVRSCELFVKEGTPGGGAPALTRAGSIYEIGLANVTVRANSEQISNTNIQDTRPDASRCGFISAIAKLDVSQFFAQTQAALDEFATMTEAEFTQWQQAQKDAFEDWSETEEQTFVTWSTDMREEYVTWSTEQQAAFITWFNNLQVILDENVAARLTAEVEALKAADIEIEADLSELSEDVTERLEDLEKKIEGGIPKKTSDLVNDGGGEPQKRGTIPNTYKFYYPNIFLTEASITRNEGTFYEVGTASKRISIKLKNTDIVNVYCNKYGVNPNSVVVEQEGDFTDIIASFEPSVVADTSFKVFFEVIFIDNLN